MRLLLVEDNERLAGLVAAGLTKAGFEVDTQNNATDAQAALQSVSYAAMVLDLGLPDRDGIHLLRELRQSGDALPVLILTARGGLEDRVRGLNSGADDYLVKPFAQEELVARLRALLRRPGGLLGDALVVGALRLDTVSREVTANGKHLSLSPREVAVLEILMRRAGRAVPKKLVEDHLFGLSGDGSSNAIEVYVHRLRKQLADAQAGVAVHTMRGVGYLMTQLPADNG